MMGMGLSATPIASGRDRPIASPMPPASNRLQHPAHHDLDVTVVARVVLGDDIAEPGGSSFQDWRPVATSEARANARSLPQRWRLWASGNGSAHLAWDRAELAPQPQVVADRPVLDHLAVLEAEDVDVAEGHRLVGGGQPLNCPVCRPWKVQ